MKPRNYKGQSLVDFTADAPGWEPLNPLGGPLSPEPKPVYHSDECSCETCCDIRASMDLYLDGKRNLNINNWWNS